MESLEHHYREQVTQAWSALSFAGFGKWAPSLDQIRLDQIFVRLHLTTERDKPRTLGKPGDERAANARDERDEPISLVEALGKPLLVVGEPGAGKSTLLRWLAVTFAQGRQREPDRLGQAADADRLPILIDLGRLPTPYLTENSRQLPNWETLLPEEMLKQDHFRHTPPEVLQHALKEGRCLLLFDGLDEVANRQTRARLAQALAQVSGLYPGNRIVVGTRPAGLTGESEGALRPTFQRCQIQRFTQEDLQRFFRFWYALDHSQPPAAQEREADALYNKIKSAPGTLSLAGTPLLATLLLLIWRKEGTLPERRVDLYERCCRLLVEEWERGHDVAYRDVYTMLDTDQHLQLLASIAYTIHRLEQRTRISQDEVRSLLEASLRNEGGHAAELSASRFLETLGLRSGLLQFLGDGEYGFPHLTFQEYLAARHIAAQPDPLPINLVLEHLHEAWWQEVRLLTIGRLGSGPQGAAQAAALLYAILHRYRPPSRFLHSSRHGWLRLIAPGKWLPGVQLVRRLAWMLRREELFALWGAGECAPDGLPPALSDDLAVRAATLAQAMFADQVWGPLLYGWLGAPGRRLAPQTSRAIARVLVAALRDPDLEVHQAAVESLEKVGSGQEAVISALLAALRDPDEQMRWAAVESLGKVGSGQEAVVSALLAALRDPDEQMRWVAVESLGKVGSGQEAVISALLTLLRRSAPSSRMRLAAVRSLGQVGSGQEAVISALLAALRDPDWVIRVPAIDGLGQMKITNPRQLRLVVIALNRCLYALEKIECESALEAISHLVAGRPLPGSRWKPVRSRQERARRRAQAGRLSAAVIVLLALILGGAWLSGVPPFNSLFAGLGSVIGLIAGLAGLAGVTLRDLWNRWNRDREHKPN